MERTPHEIVTRKGQEGVNKKFRELTPYEWSRLSQRIGFITIFVLQTYGLANFGAYKMTGKGLTQRTSETVDTVKDFAMRELQKLDAHGKLSVQTSEAADGWAHVRVSVEPQESERPPETEKVSQDVNFTIEWPGEKYKIDFTVPMKVSVPTKTSNHQKQISPDDWKNDVFKTN